ncbi:MAG TPA: VOC family protein [Candidatus Limnocylindrales bacterium]|nr:VOC family protein [Candidatus Limnocylindrales bacterium]
MFDVFDHVTLRIADLEASHRFYELALRRLGYEDPYRADDFSEWGDLSIWAAGDGRPATRNLHLALLAASREDVDGWWEAMTAAGYEDDGAPGPRPEYSPDYYGAFVRDPSGNSVEAVHHGEPREGENRLDHLWIRVRDLDASRRFYEAVAPAVGLYVRAGDAGRFHVTSGGRSFALVRDTPVTVNVHLAFPAPDRATVEAFHRAALTTGCRDNGGPGERDYHPGYYAAYVLDPDGNNVEAVFHDRRRRDDRPHRA